MFEDSNFLYSDKRIYNISIGKAIVSILVVIYDAMPMIVIEILQFKFYFY